ncbi:Alpha-1,6-mannosylglycoprotein 6-beta-N-acetylglucosaminyltransferase A [Stylophora pistillata]|uniref:alpha-1,6-mannosyl-glycoprotein 6-beta-N-acetylglucosaminyltransferase n=1 Tax=Stylophora pistillata TaxID=50429 RepID=A0A2B4RW23_STYPI|nr:Alpha-1,6-mannosylglycoprotein 6-beta-N-acetylglucosaminyltransferase A [Stylophora pistillata]
MLSRITNLEEQVESVIINSTSEFQHLTNAIKSLNRTINNITKWMKEHWTSEPKYAKHVVNGSLCSILKYLSEVEQLCPRNYKGPKRQPEVEKCVIPSDSAFPHCSEKVKWMQKFWQSDTKYTSHGVDGSICSFLKYLSEVENFCPLRRGGHLNNDCEIPTSKEFPECSGKIAWMRQFWKTDKCYKQDHGVNGSICSFIIYLSEILIHIGLLSNEKKLHFAEEAGKGGPLGELVQWSDVITSLYILGHDITVTADLVVATRQVNS